MTSPSPEKDAPIPQTVADPHAAPCDVSIPSGESSGPHTLPLSHPAAAGKTSCEEAAAVVARPSGPSTTEETGVYASGSDAPPSTGVNTPPPVPPTLGRMPGADVRPERIGDYEVLGELGRGGMGVVYKARHVTLKRLAAIKMILSGVRAGGDALQRFRREAEAVALIKHPNIIQIFEVGEAGGCPFFALEYVEGGGLDKYLAGNPQPPREAAALVAVLARAMQAAHEAGLVHRDLKPANVLLRRKVETAATAGPAPLSAFEPKISDFGLAKHIDGGDAVTVSGVVLGTPSYMPPEQAAGRMSLIGPRTDVYSLAAVLYDLLTGRPPFKGATMRETLMQVYEQEPAPPHRLNAQVPRDLETICLKGLQKDPRRRYASAQALADDLQNWLDGKPIQARPVGTVERWVKWARRSPGQAAAAVLLVLLLGVGTTGVVLYGLYQNARREASDQRFKALLSSEQKSASAAAAEVKGDWALALAEWGEARALLDAARVSGDDPLRANVEAGMARAAARARAPAELQRLNAQAAEYEKHRNAAMEGAVSIADRDAAGNRAKVLREAPLALQALGLKKDLSAETVVAVLEPFHTLYSEDRAFALFASGTFELLLLWAEAATPPQRAAEAENKADLESAMRVLDAAAALAVSCKFDTPRAYHFRRADVLSRLGRRDEAQAERDRAAARKPQTALDHFLDAKRSCLEREFPRAAAACTRALALEPRHFWANYLQAFCYARAGDWRDARAGFDFCLKERPDLRWALLQRGVANGELKDYARAAADFAAALQLPGDDAAFRALVLHSRAVVRLRQQNWGDALADLKEAVKLQSDSAPYYSALAQAHQSRRSAFDGAGCLVGPGVSPFTVGDLDAAAAALDRALKLLPASEPGRIALVYSRARVHALRGDLTGAIRDFQSVVALGLQAPDRKVPASAHVELAYRCRRDGAFDAALEHLAAALDLVADFAPAYRERAETFLALKRDAEAAQDLDRYLDLDRGKAPPEVFVARALLHAKDKELTEALLCCGEALRLRKDPLTYSLRGWIYLKLENPASAALDFDLALKIDPHQLDALCGRARARMHQGRQADAQADVERALEDPAVTPRVLVNAAVVFAAAARRDSGTGAADNLRTTLAAHERALRLLQQALDETPEAGREKFWRDHIRDEPSFGALRRSDGMLKLMRRFGL
jgi:tetratricopeptide (TPR) repeat protein